MTRTESRLELMERAEDQDASVGELVSRLAHEGKELAVVELKRLRVEMREQARRAARTAAAGYLAIDLIALATLALSVGVFLVLADAWDSYAAAAFATSGLLVVAALVVGLAVRAMMKRMTEVVEREVEDLGKDGRALRGAS
ncbi:MAG TPA: phage holin family protein [Kofleriaceae bacterium]|nr:phage holin family protein [Kofleriaceae bacterium]